jgi:hypothetical protein
MQRLFLCAALCAQEKCGAVAPIFLERGGFVARVKVSAPGGCQAAFVSPGGCLGTGGLNSAFLALGRQGTIPPGTLGT